MSENCSFSLKTSDSKTFITEFEKLSHIFQFTVFPGTAVVDLQENICHPGTSH